MRRYAIVEARLRRALLVEMQHVVRLDRVRADTGDPVEQRLPGLDQLDRVVEPGEREQLGGAGLLLGEPAPPRLFRLGRGFEIVQRDREVVFGHVVQRHVVNLDQHGEGALGQPRDVVEAVDDVHLPDGTVHVHGPRVQPRGEDAELPPVARFRQCYVAHVEFEVEVLVVNPVRVVDVEGNLDEPLAEDSRRADPVVNVLEDALEVRAAARDRRRIVEVDRRQVLVTSRLVGIQEERIGTAKLTHRGLSRDGTPGLSARKTPNLR